MSRFVIGLVVGLLLGGVLTFFIFVGSPRAGQAPGAPIKAPDQSGLPPGTAQIVIREPLFNEILGTVFTQMQPPKFPLGTSPETLAADQNACGQITVLREGSGVQTGVRFENGRMGAPIAFTGSYNSPVGCLEFSGWAQARMDLRFDQQTQSVFGQLNVETVNLDGLNPVFSALVTPIVQSTLNARVNPIRIIDGKQIAVSVPIVAASGNLNAQVQDVRAEIKDNALNLFVIYGFSGGPMQQAETGP